MKSFLHFQKSLKSSNWVETMNLEKSADIQDIESVLFGTQHGVLSWKPTERTKSRAISCGEIFSASKNSKSLVLSQKNGLFEYC